MDVRIPFESKGHDYSTGFQGKGSRLSISTIADLMVCGPAFKGYGISGGIFRDFIMTGFVRDAIFPPRGCRQEGCVVCRLFSSRSWPGRVNQREGL
jgi:hypothetical protein